MTRFFTALLALTLAMVAMPAHAQDDLPAWRTGRAILFIHGNLPLDGKAVKAGKYDEHKFSLTAHLLPTTNMVVGWMPLAYVGLRAQPMKEFGVEGAFGWLFVVDEPVFSLRFHVKKGPFRAWLNTNFRTPSFGGKLQIILDAELAPWLRIGGEYDGWGSWPNHTGWSHGVGPTVMLRWPPFLGLDLCLQARHNWIDGETAWTAGEFTVRIHLFFSPPKK